MLSLFSPPLRVTALVPRTALPDSAALWLFIDEHGRGAVAFALNIDDAEQIGKQFFGGAGFEASKLRSELGTPPF